MAKTAALLLRTPGRWPRILLVLAALGSAGCQDKDSIAPQEFQVTVTAVDAVKAGSEEALLPLEGLPVSGATITLGL